MPSFYRCENEFGGDPCTFAQANRSISVEEAIPSMDGSGAKCPGRTVSGKPCERKLVPIEGSGSWGKVPKKISLMIAGGVLGAIALVWFVLLPMFQKKSNPSFEVVPATLVFSIADDGTAKGSILISNKGEEKLLIRKIRASPAQFISQRQELEVVPGNPVSLLVVFDSSIGGDTREGMLQFQTNDPNNESVTIRLIVKKKDVEPKQDESEPADPWWILDLLEDESRRYQDNNK